MKNFQAGGSNPEPLKQREDDSQLGILNLEWEFQAGYRISITELCERYSKTFAYKTENADLENFRSRWNYSKCSQKCLGRPRWPRKNSSRNTWRNYKDIRTTNGSTR